MNFEYVSPGEDRVGPLCCYPKIHPPILGRLGTPQEAKVLWVSPVHILGWRRRELNRFPLKVNFYLNCHHYYQIQAKS